MRVGELNGENNREIGRIEGGRKEIVAYGNDCIVCVEQTILRNHLVMFGVRQV